MDGFLNWFYDFITNMLRGIWSIIYGIFTGVVRIFNFPDYFRSFSLYSRSFTVIDWIVSIIAFILVYAIWAIIIVLIVFGIRKYIRFRSTIVGNEDVLEELAGLHRDVVRLTNEKEKIMALKIGQSSIPIEEINEIFQTSREADAAALNPHNHIQAEGTSISSVVAPENTSSDGRATSKTSSVPTDAKRFFRLSAVDEKYEYYIEPTYREDLDLKGIVTEFRNFACSQMHLFYDEKTIRLMFAGLASTKLILLQGISGTGKTSLPYAMGKFFDNDSTIASVQPSWRDRTELFGYFNEFTKKFNETEVLKRIYEASYNDNINIVVLDEMNIARVEYYFAEMLSVLEMPDPNEWKIELVPSAWDSDPKHLVDGKLKITQNVWYVGTANNDDSTYAVSDKVYDRALVINLDSKGIPFDAPETGCSSIRYSYIEKLYEKAQAQYPVSNETLENISSLDMYVIQKFRVAFGNRILKQLRMFVPVFVACGGTELEGVDYIFATKMFRKFESLNLSLIRDEIDGLIDFLNKLFGSTEMQESKAYLERIKRMY